MRSISWASETPSRRASSSNPILVSESTRQLYTSVFAMHYTVVQASLAVNAENSIDSNPTCVALRLGARRTRLEICLGADVARVSEAENQVADAAEKEQENDAEHWALTKGFRDVNGQKDGDDAIGKRNEKQDEPPSWPAGNLQEDVGIVKRDQGRPSGLAGFLKNLPHTDDGHRHDGQDDHQHRTSEERCHNGVAILLQEQRCNHWRHKSPWRTRRVAFANCELRLWGASIHQTGNPAYLKKYADFQPSCRPTHTAIQCRTPRLHWVSMRFRWPPRL